MKTASQLFEIYNGVEIDKDKLDEFVQSEINRLEEVVKQGYSWIILYDTSIFNEKEELYYFKKFENLGFEINVNDNGSRILKLPV